MMSQAMRKLFASINVNKNSAAYLQSIAKKLVLCLVIKKRPLLDDALKFYASGTS